MIEQEGEMVFVLDCYDMECVEWRMTILTPDSPPSLTFPPQLPLMSIPVSSLVTLALLTASHYLV